MSYSEGLTCTDSARAKRWARASKAIQALLDKETGLEARAHLRAAFGEIYHAERLSYGDLTALRACDDTPRQNPCPTCNYARRRAAELAKQAADLMKAARP